MDLLDDAIGFEHKKIPARRGFHYSAVVARASLECLQGFPERKMRQKLIEQPVFAEVAQFHCGTISGNASTVSVTALKSECMAMATRIERLHS